MPAKLLTRITFASALAFVAAAAIHAQGPGRVPRAELTPEDRALRDRRIAEQMSIAASEIAILDRTGKTVATLGERATLYDSPVLSPDKTRLIVSRFDPETQIADLWLFDIASSKSTKITSHAQREFSNSVVWSPDGREIAYAGLRTGYFGVYRKLADGSKPEELLYKSPGGFIGLADWTRDGRFLLFAVSDLVNGVIYAMPFSGADRTPVEVFRTKTQVASPALSPDGRSLAYFANESG
jgi:Tol biopolymer transport system component